MTLFQPHAAFQLVSHSILISHLFSFVRFVNCDSPHTENGHQGRTKIKTGTGEWGLGEGLEGSLNFLLKVGMEWFLQLDSNFNILYKIAYVVEHISNFAFNNLNNEIEDIIL